VITGSRNPCKDELLSGVRGGPAVYVAAGPFSWRHAFLSGRLDRPDPPVCGAAIRFDWRSSGVYTTPRQSSWLLGCRNGQLDVAVTIKATLTSRCRGCCGGVRARRLPGLWRGLRATSDNALGDARVRRGGPQGRGLVTIGDVATVMVCTSPRSWLLRMPCGERTGAAFNMTQSGVQRINLLHSIMLDVRRR
jgi:hypothetical protein